ncbi:divalent-cation tolerance protein CutA [Natrarchaeobaculum aegyptiacum]|uniref:Divalent-cation tolerance protein CutA n=1 Tax=Natrarchaeobaculum aegyptiacum TaxID=745377 RepID=A0A2Z2I161_9EURY|nr:divalent-cation tolerance protein CutA [Natrarchaeobaculum aegyptiacum]ARS91444.1 divalent-cation tolerance protein CutA [Natrarchaeobaculum aegyptiacum]
MTTVYVTVPTDHADDIATTLVEERLAACVNRFPITSTYRWEDEVHTDDEVALLVKTTDKAYRELEERVLDLHPHDVPCIERFNESHVLEAFADWREEATT